jgi:hypothetical protein
VESSVQESVISVPVSFLEERPDADETGKPQGERCPSAHQMKTKDRNMALGSLSLLFP